MTITVRARTVIAALAVIATVAAGSAVAGATLAPRIVAPATAFPDVPAGAFYTGAVKWAKDNGITTGVGDTGLFQPDADVTRGQMVTFLERLYDITLPRGEIVMRTGAADIEPFYLDPVPTLQRFVNATRVIASPSSRVVVPIAGPASVGGVDHVLQSVRWCRSSGGATITQVELFDSDASGAADTVASASTGWPSAGCYEISAGELAEDVQLRLTFGSGSVTLYGITSTWVPVDQFVPG